MSTKGLKNILKRVELWPQSAQAEALQSLRAIEQDFNDPGSMRELEELRSQAQRGEGISLEKLREELDL